MAGDVAELRARIQALDEADKAALIRSLIAELDGDPDSQVQETWLREAERRDRELADGRTIAIPGDQVFENARTRLTQK